MPRKDFLSAFLGLSLAVLEVSAGNAWFEPLTRFSSSDISNQPLETITANDTTRDPFSRGSEEAPEKRYVIVDTKSPGTAYGLWPEKTIKFCFEDTESQGVLYEQLIKGMDPWYQAGLDSDFKMIEVSDSDCKNKRFEVMVISLREGLSTTPALPVNAPSTMVLTNNDLIGMQNVISNVAHEISHAWVLFHEHQNPKFWNDP